MNKVALFIRDHGTSDILDLHPDEASEKTGRTLPSDPNAANAEIASSFDPDRTFYTIAGIPAGSC